MDTARSPFPAGSSFARGTPATAGPIMTDPSVPARLVGLDNLARFESLGGTDARDEFVRVQRACGLEPRGLLATATLDEETLIRLLESDFDGIGDPGHVLVGPGTGSDEWWIRDPRHALAIRSGIRIAEAPLSRLTRRLRARLSFLRERLLDDLAEGARIFVFRATGVPASEARLNRLEAALQAHGDARLLYVRAPDATHPPGSVRMREGGGLIGCLEPPANAANPDVEGWLALCGRAWRILDQETEADGLEDAPIPLDPALASPPPGAMAGVVDASVPDGVPPRADAPSVPAVAGHAVHPVADRDADGGADGGTHPILDAGLVVESGTGPGLVDDEAADVMRARAAALAQPGQASCWLALCEALVRAGRSEEAHVQALQAFAHARSGPASFAALGDLLLSLHDPDGAETAFRAAIDLAPAVPQFHDRLARVLAQCDRIPEAIEARAAALSRAPERVGWWSQLGGLQSKAGRHADAVASFRRAAGLAPENPAILGALAMALVRCDQIAEALPLASRAVGLDSGNPQRLAQLAQVLALTGDLAAAVETQRRAVERDGRNVALRLTLGSLLLRHGQHGAALVEAEAAVALQPDSVRSLGLVARAALAVGRFERAAAALARAAELDPGNPVWTRQLAEARARRGAAGASP